MAKGSSEGRPKTSRLAISLRIRPPRIMETLIGTETCQTEQALRQPSSMPHAAPSSVGGVSAADAKIMPTTLAVPAPDRVAATEPLGLPSAGTWHIDDAFFDGALPHCLTHKPALQDCWDCLRAKRRHVKRSKAPQRGNRRLTETL